MVKLEYPITRTFSSRFTWTVIVLQILLLVVITLINVFAVGHETVSATSTSFNSTTNLWYEKFLSNFWPSQSSRSCDSAVIPFGGG